MFSIGLVSLSVQYLRAGTNRGFAQAYQLALQVSAYKDHTLKIKGHVKYSNLFIVAYFTHSMASLQTNALRITARNNTIGLSALSVDTRKAKNCMLRASLNDRYFACACVLLSC